jgi:hypothetical protein
MFRICQRRSIASWLIRDFLIGIRFSPYSIPFTPKGNCTLRRNRYAQPGLPGLLDPGPVLSSHSLLRTEKKNPWQG